MNLVVIIYSLIAGLIFSFGLPPKLFPGLEWVAFIPILGILLFDLKKKRYYFYAGFLSGFATIGKYLFWFFKSAPLTWIGISSLFWSELLVGLIWFLAIIYFAFWFGLFILFIKYFETGKVWDIFLIALSWPIFEFWRTFFYAFYPPIYGDGNIVGNHMALGIFGYSLANYYFLRQWSVIGGDYFLSFILVLANALGFYILKILINNKNLFFSNYKLFFKKFDLNLVFPLIIFIILILGGNYLIGEYLPSKTAVSVADIQLNFPVGVWSSFNYPLTVFNKIKAEINQAIIDKPSTNLIVIPEGADFTQFSGNQLNGIQSLLGVYPYRVIIDGSYNEFSSRENNLAVFDNQKGFLGKYAKRFLMPFGEYLPAIINFPVSLVYPNWLYNFSYRWYQPGNKAGIFSTHFGLIGTLACSEIISPQLSRQEARQGAQIITYAASDSIFRGSSELHAQNLAMAQIRATETRRGIVYASNGEKSFIIDSFGNILWEANSLNFQNGYADIPLNSSLTFYDQFGDWFIFFSALVIFLGIMLYRKK